MTKPSKKKKLEQRKAERKVLDFAEPVRKAHIWRPGHDPNDPDAYEGSGWEYVKLLPLETDPTNKTDRHTKGGGPESGFPCQNCGEMTRIADEYAVTQLLEMVFRFTNEQREQIKDKKVYILICPKCESVVQFRKEFLDAVRERWLAEGGNND